MDYIKKILFIISTALLSVALPPLLYAAGPSPDGFYEDFYITATETESSTIITYHYPDTNQATPNSFRWFSYVSTGTVQLGTYTGYFETPSTNTQTLPGIKFTEPYNAYFQILPDGSGYSPQDPDCAYAEVVKMPPFARLSTLGDWSCDDYDIDEFYGEYMSSTEMTIDLTWPDSPSGTIKSPIYFETQVTGIAPVANRSTRFVYDIWNASTTPTSSASNLQVYCPPFNTTTTDYGNICNNKYNLYEPYKTIPYNIRVTFQYKDPGDLVWTNLLTDWASFSVDQRAVTSSVERYEFKPFETSSAQSAAQQVDCGDWYQFNLGCHVRNIVIWTFVPKYWQPGSQDISPIATVWTQMYSTFPFSIFSAEKQFIQETIATTTQSADLYFQFNIAGQTSSVKVAGYNMLEDTFGTDLTNLWFNACIVLFVIAALRFMWVKTIGLIA